MPSLNAYELIKQDIHSIPPSLSASVNTEDQLDRQVTSVRQRHVPIFVGTENESRDFDGTRLETFRDTKRVVVVVALSPIDVFGRQRRVDHVGW